MSLGKRLAAMAGISFAIILLSGSAAFAHDCFNPTKKPTAGVHYELTGFDANGNPTFVQLGNGKGNGGFAEIAPGVFGPGQTIPLYSHTLGSGNNPHGVVGGPGSHKPEHACNGKGIDYIDACFGG